VKLTGLLMSESRLRTHNRRELAIKILNEQSDVQGEITVPQLVELVKSVSEDEGDAKRWIQRNAQQLATDSSSTYTARRGRSGGLFIRQGDI